MRILQVLHDFVDTNAAGTELYTYYLSRELKKRHEVAVFYYSDDIRSEFGLRESSYDGIKTFVVNVYGWNMWSILNYQNPRVDKLFRKVLSDFRPDLVHFQHLLFSSMNFPNIAKCLEYPTVHTLHDFYLICPKARLIDTKWNRCEEITHSKCFGCCLSLYKKMNLMSRLVVDREYWTRLIFHLFWKRPRMVKDKVVKDVDLFISPSKFLRNKFILHGIPASKIIYSDNGMNLEILEGDMCIRESDNCLTFGYIGSHQVEKGVPLLIDAFNEIENAQLYIYGSGGKSFIRAS